MFSLFFVFFLFFCFFFQAEDVIRVRDVTGVQSCALPILYYIEGYADDVRTLVLDNFTVENTTHYDFYWYAIDRKSVV